MSHQWQFRRKILCRERLFIVLRSTMRCPNHTTQPEDITKGWFPLEICSTYNNGGVQHCGVRCFSCGRQLLCSIGATNSTVECIERPHWPEPRRHCVFVNLISREKHTIRKNGYSTTIDIFDWTVRDIQCRQIMITLFGESAKGGKMHMNAANFPFCLPICALDSSRTCCANFLQWHRQCLSFRHKSTIVWTNIENVRTRPLGSEFVDFGFIREEHSEKTMTTRAKLTDLDKIAEVIEISCSERVTSIFITIQRYFHPG